MNESRLINESKHHHGADPSIKFKARELRKRSTEVETLLWERIRRKKLCGKHFRRQHPYGIYILDFYCFEANLALELDGDIHQFKMEYDKERTEYLKDTGLTLLRFKNEDVIKNMDKVLSEIEKHLKKVTNFKQMKAGLSPLGETGKGVD